MRPLSPPLLRRLHGSFDDAPRSPRDRSVAEYRLDLRLEQPTLPSCKAGNSPPGTHRDDEKEVGIPRFLPCSRDKRVGLATMMCLMVEHMHNQ